MNKELTLLECIPNVSCGKDAGIIKSISQATKLGITKGALKDSSKAELIDIHSDSDHNRSVFSIVGQGSAFEEGVAALAQTAIELVDLNKVQGVHPRLGALDVLPFVCLKGNQDYAFSMMRKIAKQIGDKYKVPFVRYGLNNDGKEFLDAARTGLMRKGGSKRLLERVDYGELQLLAGPNKVHPAAGITLCGVRNVLVAFNLELETPDVNIAQQIASRIREASKGPDSLHKVRALGFYLSSLNVAQVSTNIEDPSRCSPAKVLERVVKIAQEYQIKVKTAELVGLCSEASLAQLKYACIRNEVGLVASVNASLDAAIKKITSDG